MHINKFFSALAIYLVSTVNVVAAETTPPEVTVDGLHLVEGTEMARLFINVFNRDIPFILNIIATGFADRSYTCRSRVSRRFLIKKRQR